MELMVQLPGTAQSKSIFRGLLCSNIELIGINGTGCGQCLGVEIFQENGLHKMGDGGVRSG